MDKEKSKLPLVYTVKDRCKVCYTCVRECPAKAIRIVDGQAEVVAERCIACGNCIRVCSRNAKKALDSKETVYALLKGTDPVSACIAPSFPAEFSDIEHTKLVGMLKAMGFNYVHEVGFGADLVSREIKRLLSETDKKYISSACPAVFRYVKKYKPELTDYLMPVVSPMVATARALKHLYGQSLKIVFIGPCIAKKGEAYSKDLDNEIAEVLTFNELREMFAQSINHNSVIEQSDFDPPHPGKGSLFPVRRGLLESAEIHEDLITCEVVSANGRKNFIEALNEFESGDLDARFLDLLCCDGCIMGAGMTNREPLYKKRTRVSKYVRKRFLELNAGQWRTFMGKLRDVDLSRDFTPDSQKIEAPDSSEITAILKKMGKFRPEDELNCGACGYETCREHAVAISKGMAESEMCLPYTIEQLHKTIDKLHKSNKDLANAKEALIQSEKLASMGQLAAGIAHEVNNPLGVVIMYSHLLLEDSEKYPELYDDLAMITEHADRAKKIVSGLLRFARQNKVNAQRVNICEIIDSSIPVKIPKTVILEKLYKVANPYAELDRDQIIQVLTNLINNSLTAMDNRGVLKITAEDTDNEIVIEVSDNGCGISDDIKSKIFEPFFTTKPTGKGTGLGLAIAYGIIKMHNGSISVESNNDPVKGPVGTKFMIKIPRYRSLESEKTYKEVEYGK